MRERICKLDYALATRRKRFKTPTHKRGYIRYWLCESCFELYGHLETLEQLEEIELKMPIVGLQPGPAVHKEWHKYVYGGQKRKKQ